MFNKEIKNSDGSTYLYEISSNDNYRVNIGNNYKLIKFYKTKKSFKDTILGSDIGVNSRGFASVAVVSTLIAVFTFIIMMLSFRI